MSEKTKEVKLNTKNPAIASIKKTNTKKSTIKSQKTTTSNSKAKTNTQKKGKKTVISKTTKKATLSKNPTKKVSKSSTKTSKYISNVEYYDLPYRYNQTIVRILAQTPTTLFVYWDISDEDRENFKKEYGDSFFETTHPVLIIHNDTMNYSFEVDINDFANSWYLKVNDSSCDYRIELGRRPNSNSVKIDKDYIYISSSNEIESPNDHILFDKNQKMVYFRNVKTNKETPKDATNLSFIQNMGKVYNIYEDSEDTVLPDFSTYNSNVIVSNKIEYSSHTTKPPARYTESKLIKEMEELGIGRPSTYAKTIDTIKERNYVKVEDKKFIPTEIGIETTDKLQEFFKDIINVEYTKNMEDDLDKIAEGDMEWYKLLKMFYDDFEPKVEVAFKEMEKKAPEKTGEICPNCGSELVIKQSRYGKFVACSNYPTCKYIKNDKEEKKVVEIMNCPKCDGKVVEKKTKRGKIFYGCLNYPKCDFATWDKPLEEKCPNCHGTLVEKKDKIKCMNCDYEKDNG